MQTSFYGCQPGVQKYFQSRTRTKFVYIDVNISYENKQAFIKNKNQHRIHSSQQRKERQRNRGITTMQ